MSDELKELLFTWEGRVNRAKWWGFGFGAWLTIFVLYGVSYLLVISDFEILGYIAFGITFLASIGLAVSGVMVTIKRWHDRGKPGWWIFIYFVPVIGPIWALIELGFLPGDEVDNEWGPNPLDPAAARR